MLKHKAPTFFILALTLVCGYAAAAETPGTSFAASDLARRLGVPESKINAVSAENGVDGTVIVSLQVTPAKSGKPTHRYTLRPSAGAGGSAFQVVRVDRTNGTHDEYEYDGAGRLSVIKQFGRQNKQLHTAFYARDAKTNLDRIAHVLHNDWTKPRRDFIDSFDVYHYGASRSLEKVERYPSEAEAKPENLFLTFFYEGAPALERIVKSVDLRGMPVEYVYDENDELAQTLADDKTVTDHERDEFGEVVARKTTDFRGMETVFSYGDKGVLTKTSAANGVVTDFTTINDTVLPSKKSEPSGRSTVYEYDASGLPTKITTLGDKNEVINVIKFTNGAGTAGGGTETGFLKSAASSEGFKYTYTQVHYKDVVETATDPNGRTKVYTYDEAARPKRVVHRQAQVFDDYDYSGQKGLAASPVVKRYASKSGSDGGELIGTFKYDADKPVQFDFADGSSLVYEKGVARELRSAQNGLLLTYKNEITPQEQLIGFKVYDASGKELGSYAAYKDPVEVAAEHLKGKAA